MTLNSTVFTYGTEKLQHLNLPFMPKTVMLSGLIQGGQYTTQDIKINPLKTDKFRHFPALSVLLSTSTGLISTDPDLLHKFNNIILLTLYIKLF